MANINEMAGQRSPSLQEQQQAPRRTVSLEERRRMRHEARVSQTWKKFLRRIEAYGLSEEQAEKAAVAVLCTLEERLVGNESEHLEAQLPLKLREMLHRCEMHEDIGGPDMRKIGRKEFLERISAHFTEEEGDAEHMARAVFGAVHDHIDKGEVRDVIDQLPADLKELWHPVH
jgi:uncharacterized protein (DUF2267 family)